MRGEEYHELMSALKEEGAPDTVVEEVLFACEKTGTPLSDMTREDLKEIIKTGFPRIQFSESSNEKNSSRYNLLEGLS